MIRTVENEENLQLNIFLKNGDSFMKKDIPDNPFGQNEKVVSFWNEGKLMMYPMDQVEHIELLF